MTEKAPLPSNDMLKAPQLITEGLSAFLEAVAGASLYVWV